MVFFDICTEYNRLKTRYSNGIMATRLVHVATLLMVMSCRERSAVMSTAQLDNGRCEKITIPLCTGMKYNMTRMPNLVGISNQNEAALQVCVDLSVCNSSLSASWMTILGCVLGLLSECPFVCL